MSYQVNLRRLMTVGVELVNNASLEMCEQASLTTTFKDLMGQRDSEFKRTSMRRERDLGDLLVAEGKGHLNKNRTFTFYSGDGYLPVTIQQAVEAERRLFE